MSVTFSYFTDGAAELLSVLFFVTLLFLLSSRTVITFHKSIPFPARLSCFKLLHTHTNINESRPQNKNT
jgi:hypothetical protein